MSYPFNNRNIIKQEVNKVEDRLFIDLERIEMEFQRLIDERIDVREMTVVEIFNLCMMYSIDL